MRKKEVERKAKEEFEQTLSSSGVSFDALASKVDFSKYKKKHKPFFKKPWAYALASFAFVVVATGTTIGIVLGTKGYNHVEHQFYEGVYLFSEITSEYNVEELPKPDATDKIVISNEPTSKTYYALSKTETGYEGYLSVFGVLEEYKMTVTESYQGGLKFSFNYADTDFFARIYGSVNEKDIFCSIEAPSKSFSFVFSK